MACNYKDIYSGLCASSISQLTLYSLGQTAFPVTGDWTFGHAFLSPSLPYSSSLSSTSLSMKSCLMVLTRLYPLSRGLNVYHQSCSSIVAFATLQCHIGIFRQFSERGNHSDFCRHECCVWHAWQRLPQFSQ